MAGYTSAASGDWQAAAASVWNAAGAYPGDTGSQADTATIANGHTVDLDWADVAGTVAITVQSGGTLRVSAAMTATADITGLTVNAGGTVTFEAGATRRLIVNGNISVSGTITQDSSGEASATYTIAVQCASDNQYKLTVNNGGTYTIKGRTTGTIATLTNGAITAGTRDFNVDAKSGWAVGDLCVVASTGANAELVTLAAPSGAGDFSAVFGKSHPDNTRIYHIARSSVFTAQSASYMTSLVVAAGGILDADYAWFDYQDEVTLNSTALLTPAVGCSFTRYESGEYGIYVGAANLEITNCVFYSAAVSSAVFIGIDGPALFSMSGCAFVHPANNASQFGINTAGSSYGLTLSLTACEFVQRNGCFVRPPDYMAIVLLSDCYMWGGGGSLSNSGSSNNPAMFAVTNCIFGYDPGGNSSQIATLANITGSAFDACLFNLSGAFCTAANMLSLSTTVSTQHNQLSAARYEAQRYGTITKVADTDFASDVCDEVDPSSASYPVLYRLAFPCASEMTPTLTIYHKQVESGSNSIENPVTVRLGDRRCGLTAVATGATFAPNNSLTSQSITFTGTTTRAGEVEVIIEVKDEASETGATLRLGDFSVSGNL